jgi:histone H3/H4
MARKVNYLNNKDILKEIAKSKLTYCSFVSDEVKSYDMIVLGVDKITKKAVQEARKARAERLAKEAQEAELLLGNKRKLDEFLTPTKDIPVTDVVFRVMTWEHIPIDDVKQKKADAKAQEEYDELMTQLLGSAPIEKIEKKIKKQTRKFSVLEEEDATRNMKTLTDKYPDLAPVEMDNPLKPPLSPKPKAKPKPKLVVKTEKKPSGAAPTSSEVNTEKEAKKTRKKKDEK